MPKTSVRENETLDDALRRFKRQVMLFVDSKDKSTKQVPSKKRVKENSF